MESQVENRLRNSAAVWLRIESGEGEDTGRAATFIAAGFLATLNYPPIRGKHGVTTITYGGGAEAREAEVVFVDRASNITLLRLTPSESDRRFEAVPLLDSSFPDVTWEVPAFDRRLNSFITIRGDVLGLQPSGDLEVIALRPHSEPPSWDTFVGATLFLNDFVAGMVVLARPDVSELHAVPSTTLRRIMEDYFLRGDQPVEGAEPEQSQAQQSQVQANEPAQQAAEMTPPGRKSGDLQSRARAQVNPDRPDGADLLDVQNEVDAISTVIAARDTEPPLSIGLFGDWGTGKSFFMSRMEKRVNDLMKLARENPESAFCPNIVQLRFNAWHYMDTDLWASLAAEIFEGLARELDRDRGLLNGKEDPAVARARLLASTSHLRALKTEAEQRKAEADAALRASEERLSSLSEDERILEAKLQPKELLKAAYRFVAAQPVTARSLEDAAQKMGIPKAKALASDTRATLLEVRSVWGGVKLAFRKGPKRLWILLSLCVALLLAVLYALVQYRTQIGPILVAVAGFLGVAIPFVRKLIPPIKEALGIIQNARADNDALIKATRDRKENELRQQHQAVQERVSAEEAAIARATQEMAVLERQLEALRAENQMDEYVRARHQSTDYTRHFGVIARARHDFEQLSDLLASARKEAADRKNAEPADAPRPPRIDRIILYIDDLDRCPEAKVVDVLQAVHLLMALPLFIVVVAVDSRWLLHSLRQQASVFKMSDELIEGMDEEERFHWESTPFNYLEKIFQIPFNLRPIDEDGFVRLIDELTKPSRPLRHSDPLPAQVEKMAQIAVNNVDAPAPPQPAVLEVTVSAPSEKPVDPRSAIPDPAVPAPTPAVAIDPNPPFLDLTPGERRFMHQMHRLIPTPRAAKRYVNVYRLLRASLPDKLRRSLEDERTGRSHCVLLMLAILTGFPQEGAVILRELVERKPEGSWWDFVELLAREAIEMPAGKAQNGSAQRAQRWRELNDRLHALRAELSSGLAEHAPCNAFHEWARLVARYSFESGRVLTATAETRAAGN